jgi:anti-sigma-K factor RskA
VADIHSSDPSRDLVAAELALGLLEGEERRAALELAMKDPSFRADFAFWQTVAEDWSLGLEPAEVSADLLSSIEAAIDESTMAATAPARPADFRVWALAATVAALLLAVGAVVLFNQVTTLQADNRALASSLAAAESQQRFAQVEGEDGAFLMSAVYRPDAGALELRVEQEQPRGGQVPELWVIAGDGIPRSLGLLRGERMQVTIPPENRALLVDGATLAVTFEPDDGKPHPSPTGPIVGSARLQAI